MNLNDGVEFMWSFSLIFVAIATTAFPMVYGFSPWRSTRLGKIVMAQAVASATVMDVLMLLHFFPIPDGDFRTVIRIISYFLIGGTSASMLFILLRLNFSKTARETFYDGEITVDSSDEKDVYSLELNIPVEDIEKKSALTFRVGKS